MIELSRPSAACFARLRWRYAEHRGLSGATGSAVDYLTALGDDPFSDEMIAGWAAEGVGTGRVRAAAGQLPGLYLIETDDSGERRFFHWRETSAARSLFDAGDRRLLDRLATMISSISPPSRCRSTVEGAGALVRGVAPRPAARRPRCLRHQFPARGWPEPDIARAVFPKLRRSRHRAGLDRRSAAALPRGERRAAAGADSLRRSRPEICSPAASCGSRALCAW